MRVLGDVIYLVESPDQRVQVVIGQTLDQRRRDSLRLAIPAKILYFRVFELCYL